MQNTVHTESLARARSSSYSKRARQRGRRRDGRRTGREEGQAALCVRVLLLVLSAFCFGVCIYAAKRVCAPVAAAASPHNSPVSNARTLSHTRYCKRTDQCLDGALRSIDAQRPPLLGVSGNTGAAKPKNTELL